ncbi:MAG: hypothetical protein V1679_02065 [Candidatus Peregrinibacteria bacterium]
MGKKETQEKLNEQSLRSVMLEKAIKAGVFALIAVLAVFGTFFAESKIGVEKMIIANSFAEFNYGAENILDERGIFRFMSEEESGFANNMNVVSSSEGGYVFDMASGKMWGNLFVDNSNLNIKADKLVLIPNHAVFDVEFDGKRLELTVFDGDVYVGILDEGVELNEYVDQYSALFSNLILVPRETQIAVSMSKIDERMNALLYSKLVKEFKYSAIPSSKMDLEWVKKNQKEDKKFIESIKHKVISDILFKGSLVSETGVGSFVFWSEENLTFVPQKRREMVFEHLFEYLDDAIYYANEGDKDKSGESFNKFATYLSVLPTDISRTDDYYNRVDEYLDKLSVFGPDEKVYSVYVKLLDKKFMEKRDRYEVVSDLWKGVYSGLNEGGVLADEALDTFYKNFDSTLGREEDLDFYRQYMTFYNQLFDNLFLRYSSFYKESYFAIKNILEQKLLELYLAGQQKEEVVQAMISNKISFLKKLRRYFFDGEISVDETKEIMAELIDEVNALMPEDDSGVAVIELFETQMEDIGNFWGYLKSPEYHISKTYGSNHEERYASYLEEKDRVWSFLNIQEEILGNKGAEKTLADVKKEVEAYFAESEDMGDLDIGSIASVDQRYVLVEGVIGGYPFKAEYDRDLAALKNVYAYDELISDRAMHLASLLGLMQEKFAEFDEEDLANEDEYTLEDVSQRVARKFVAERVSKYGFKVGIDNVSASDSKSAIYRVEDVYLDGYEDTPVTFDLMMTGEKITNVFMKVRGESIVLNDEYSLSDLANLVMAEGDFAVEGGVSR